MKAALLNKASLRAEQKARMQALSGTDFTTAGLLVARHVDEWLAFNSELLVRMQVALFHSMRDEIDTKPLAALLLGRHVSIYYPSLQDHGEMCFVRETHAVDAQDLDIIFVPGRAFDLLGHRLGRGQGHYDRALTGLINSQSPLFIGLALDNQIVEEVPCEPHDVLMHYICTPALGVFKTKGE